MGMWLLFDGGFVSVVQHRENQALLCVRGRVREDVAAFVRLAESDAAVSETPDADYRFRAVVHRGSVRTAVAKIVTALDYDNFKTRVAKSQGLKRARLYHEVWDSLVSLDDRFGKR
jgi:hypothetical protein